MESGRPASGAVLRWPFASKLRQHGRRSPQISGAQRRTDQLLVNGLLPNRALDDCGDIGFVPVTRDNRARAVSSGGTRHSYAAASQRPHRLTLPVPRSFVEKMGQV